jgi:hypothetical protein
MVLGRARPVILRPNSPTGIEYPPLARDGRALPRRAGLSLSSVVKQTISPEMTLELTDEEHRALVRLLRRSIDDDRFPLAPRHMPIRAILAKLGPAGSEARGHAAAETQRRPEC